RSSRESSSDDAICAARCTEGTFLTPAAPCFRSSSTTPSNTLTSGLGLNCSATAAMSWKRGAFRKARIKRPLWIRARRNPLHFEMITAQENRLANKRTKRISLATGPLAEIIPAISSPTANKASWEMYILLPNAQARDCSHYRETSSTGPVDYSVICTYIARKGAGNQKGKHLSTQDAYIGAPAARRLFCFSSTTQSRHLVFAPHERLCPYAALLSIDLSASFASFRPNIRNSFPSSF